jgi:hypothetical protein
MACVGRCRRRARHYPRSESPRNSCPGALYAWSRAGKGDGRRRLMAENGERGESHCPPGGWRVDTPARHNSPHVCIWGLGRFRSRYVCNCRQFVAAAYWDAFPDGQPTHRVELRGRLTRCICWWVVLGSNQRWPCRTASSKPRNSRPRSRRAIPIQWHAWRCSCLCSARTRRLRPLSGAWSIPSWPRATTSAPSTRARRSGIAPGTGRPRPSSAPAISSSSWWASPKGGAQGPQRRDAEPDRT